MPQKIYYLNMCQWALLKESPMRPCAFVSRNGQKVKNTKRSKSKGHVKVGDDRLIYDLFG